DLEFALELLRFCLLAVVADLDFSLRGMSETILSHENFGYLRCCLLSLQRKFASTNSCLFSTIQ
ncbi:MAG TPA: hypothetical protein VGP89_04580, partial [Candidatus Angelobacter sp.]|nr:hypothetical protein [Candidatus Angelobacter sp.]